MLVRTGFAGLVPRAARRWTWWVFLLSLALVALGSQSYQADAAGEGVFSLDKSAYSTPEGTAVTVGVNRTNGGVIQKDITVTLQLVGGTAGVDYPAATVTQLAVFKAGTNQTFASVQFQTLNQNRVGYTTIQVTILSVDSGGAMGSPAVAPIAILGRGAPHVTNVLPKSAAEGTAITVIGDNFAGTLCAGATPGANPGAPTLGAAPSARCLFSVDFYVLNSITPAYRAIPNVGSLSPTSLVVTVPSLTDGQTYDVRVVVGDPTVATPFTATSAPVAEDHVVFAGGVGSPTITSIFPSNGPTTGDSVVTVTGTGFAACPTWINFGSNAGTNCQLLSPTSLRITTPSAPAAGTVDVVALFGADQTPITTETRFTYTGSPTITSMSTNFGPASGGTLVTIIGTGFTSVGCQSGLPNYGVRFGAVNADGCNIISDTQMTTKSPPGTGVQQVTITNNAGLQSAFTTAANFNYVSGPVVTSISPASGPPQGGAVVVINGNGFAPGAQVTFGGVAASPVAFFSSTQLQVTAPAGKGTVHVVVSVNGASSPTNASDLFAYSIPVVDSIVPNAGPPAGGTVVVINGANFTVGTTVQFGALTVPSTFVTPLQIQATVPAGVIGVVDVRVTTPSGQSAVAPGRTFTYTTGPIIAAMNPASGPTTGGIPVVITGTNFLAGATVTFGTTAAEQVNFNSASQITALLPPASAPGVVDVRVTTSGGTSPISTLSKYTYSATVPVITLISPNKAPTIGGTTITITGIGFLGVECPGGVKFGTVPAASCTVDSDSSITAVTPANVPGDTFLTVTSASGTSELAQNFTFTATGSGGGDDGGTGGDGNGGSVPGSDVGPTTGEPVTYQLDFRWTLLVWRGANGADIATALRGTGDNDLTGKVGAIFGWDPANGAWLGYFPGQTAPGANDMQTLVRGGIYWFALSSPGAVFFTTTNG